jgi:uncharacterized protein (TIGR02001 family)
VAAGSSPVGHATAGRRDANSDLLALLRREEQATAGCISTARNTARNAPLLLAAINGAIRVHFPSVARLACVLFVAVMASSAHAGDAERWPGPFGGAFNANFTVTTDYSYAGISNTQLGPAFQVGLDYKTPSLIDAFPLWVFVTGFGTNISFPMSGPGVEIDIGGGLKLKVLDDKLSADVGYVRYTYPGIPSAFSFDYGEIVANLAYDFELFELKARLRYSPNSFGNSGASWNKRALLEIPLPFLKFSNDVSFKTYGSVGNVWVDRFSNYGLPSQDYWYWQIGLIASAFGLDFTVAYTDTSIEPLGCGNTNYCSGRIFTSVTKSF